MLRLLKNEKGAALAFAVLTTLVLMVLGTATLSLSASEASYSIRNEEQMQAEYIARAGADITAKQIIDNPSSPTDGLNGNIGEGAYSTEVTYPDSSSARIISTGVVDGSVAEVTLEMSGTTNQGIFTGIQQTGDDDLNLTKLNITYEDGETVWIEANVDDLSEIHLNNDNEKDTNIKTAINNTALPPFDVPDSTGFQTSLPELIKGKKNNPSTRTFTGNYKLTDISIGNNEKYIFDTQGKEQHIIVNELLIKGDLTLKGGGMVHLYILDSGNIQTPLLIDAEDDGILFIYVNEGKTLSLQAKSYVYVYIYAPDAIIEMTAAQLKVNGAIIAQTIKSTGNGEMGNFHYIPLPEDPDESPIQSGYSKTSYH